MDFPYRAFLRPGHDVFPSMRPYLFDTVLLDTVREHAPRCVRCGVLASPSDFLGDGNAELAPDRALRWQHRACPEAGAQPAAA